MTCVVIYWHMTTRHSYCKQLHVASYMQPATCSYMPQKGQVATCSQLHVAVCPKRGKQLHVAICPKRGKQLHVAVFSKRVKQLHVAIGKKRGIQPGRLPVSRRGCGQGPQPRQKYYLIEILNQCLTSQAVHYKAQRGKLKSKGNYNSQAATGDQSQYHPTNHPVLYAPIQSNLIWSDRVQSKPAFLILSGPIWSDLA